MTEINSAESAARQIKRVVAVMSGKGGVGKSVVTGVLAAALQRQGLRVGVLDADLAGPSIGYLFGLENQPPTYSSIGLEPPLSASGIKILSMNITSEESEPLVWRGPMVSSAFRQFYSDVDWGELDYLLVDVPPGTSDVPVTVLQALPLAGTLIVSNRQRVSSIVVKKCINMVRQFDRRVIGVVENLAYFLAPTGEYYELFGPGRAADLAEFAGAPLLGQVPLDPRLGTLCDAGRIEDYRSEALERLVVGFLAAMKNQG